MHLIRGLTKSWLSGPPMAQTDRDQARKLSLFDGLLWDLTQEIPSSASRARDILFCAVKATEGCQAEEDAIHESLGHGLLAQAFPCVLAKQANDCEGTSRCLRWMVSASARPLREIESSFAPDATVIESVSGVPLRIHVLTGTKTGVIGSAYVRGPSAHDDLQPLLEATRDFLWIFAREDRKVISTPANEASGLRKVAKTPLFARSEAALVNELYCQVIGHNLNVLIQAMCERGIAPDFN